MAFFIAFFISQAIQNTTIANVESSFKIRNSALDFFVDKDSNHDSDSADNTIFFKEKRELEAYVIGLGSKYGIMNQ